jgi:hypothetical protein
MMKDVLDMVNCVVDSHSMIGALDTKHAGHKNPKSIFFFLAYSSCRDRALLVLGSNTAKQAALTALLDPSTHFRPPLTHTNHHRPALVDLSRYIVVSGVSHSNFRRSLVHFNRFRRFFSKRFSTEC